MAQISFTVGNIYCHDCVIALRRFIGKMKGVQSVEMINDDKVVIKYDSGALDIDETQLTKLVRESIDKLGFKIVEG